MPDKHGPIPTTTRLRPGATRSIWMTAGAVPVYEELHGDVRADVCVIGAGFAGLSVGYVLAKAGRGVVIIDSGAVASGQSGMTTAHLTAALDDRYFNLERQHGR